MVLLVLCVLILCCINSLLSTFVPLFVAGEGHPCYRQPALLAADDTGTTLIAFAEWRTSNPCAPDVDSIHPNEVGGLLTRISTDGGTTFGPPATVHEGNIDFYTVVRDEHTSTLWLMLQQGSDVLVFHSHDSGVKWSTPTLLNVTVPPPFKAQVKPAVGHGVQVRGDLCGSHVCKEVGRLLMPFVCLNGSSHGDKGSCPACHSCLLSSDDQGVTWTFTGGYGQPGSRESQIVQTITEESTDTHFYITERNMGPQPGHRMYARSVNAGQTYIAEGIDMNLVTPVTAHWTGIVGSVLRLSVNPPKLVFASAADPKDRRNMTIYVSADEGATWPVGRTLWSGPAGYCDLQPIPGGIGIILEMGNVTFADRIAFRKLTPSWM